MPKLLFLIGPGAAGKTTLSKVLSQKLNYNLVDLDEEFLKQIGNISAIIETQGYAEYVTKNSNLATKIVSQLTEATVFVTSSGFLKDITSEIGKTNYNLTKQGISILLLPSKFPTVSAKIMANRQIQRSFNTKTFDYFYTESLKRHHSYKTLGNIKIFSSKPPDQICTKILAGLKSKHLLGS